MIILSVTCTTLELHDSQANAHKYYRTYEVGKIAVYQWGRVDAVGQWSANDHLETWACRAAVIDKLQEKRAKGYVDVEVTTFGFDDSRLNWADKDSLKHLDVARRTARRLGTNQAAPASSAMPTSTSRAKAAPAPPPVEPVIDALNPHAVFAARALAAISLAVTDPQRAAVEFAILNDSWKDLETQHAKAASYLKTLDQLLIGATR